MGTYLFRRLLLIIPTLFGVTVVSFFVMQLAPGDPLLSQLNSQGGAGQSSQTREAYLVQRRDLKLDKPVVLNFNYFRDYTTPIHWAAYYRGRTVEEIEQDLNALASSANDPESQSRLQFLRSLGIDDFQASLANPDKRAGLAKAVEGFVMVYSENTGLYGVPPAIGILKSETSDLKLKIGAIRCLSSMVVNPFVYVYSSQHPSEAETSQVIVPWRLWWQRQKGKFPPLDEDVRKQLPEMLQGMETAMQTPSIANGKKLSEAMDGIDHDYLPFFAETLLGNQPLMAKVVSAYVLKQFVPETLRLDVPLDASPKLVAEASENWLAQYESHRAQYDPSVAAKLWSIVSDTQYAYMVVRLVTFQFGHSALRTQEPVSGKIWNALIVSAPLMFMSELLIYLFSIPLGILCAVFRGGKTDRGISFGLFLLYSVPPFVAAMLFLVFFCYGDHLAWFPMAGLHSEGAENFSWGAYLIDYLWHAFLPVVCLSLFSLAAMAMYARSSMLDVINQDYVRTARAKGVPEHRVILKHVFRNGLIPILTLSSSFLPAMLGGSVLIEVLFSIPGMGRLGWVSIEQKDFPTLMALLYLDAIVVLISFLITDFLYVLADPRISFEGRGKAS